MKSSSKAKSKPVTRSAARPAARAEAAPAPARRSRGSFWTGFWGLGLRLWWSVTWRTLVFISLPVMLVQIIIATLRNPEVPTGLLSFMLMMLSGIPTIIGQLLATAEFWFFIAVSAWTYIGGVFIFAHLIEKKRAGNLEINVTTKK